MNGKTQHLDSTQNTKRCSFARSEGVLALLGGGTAAACHVFCMVLLVGSSGLAAGLTSVSIFPLIFQSSALLFVVAAWFFYIKRWRHARHSLLQVGFGIILIGISVYVGISWTQHIRMLL